MINAVKAVDRLSRFCEWIGDTVLWICMASMASMVFVQVIARYAFNNSIHWSEELARFLMIWLGLVGASSIMRNDSHVAITLLLERVPPKLAFFMRIIGRLAVGIFIVMLIRWGIALALFFSEQKSPALRISMSIPYSALYISGILMAVHLVNLVIEDVRKFITDN